MSEPIPILIPLINPNEKEARLVSVYIQEGSWIKKGELVASIESTKAALDLFSEAAGFVKGLSLSNGAMVLAGDILCYLVADLSQSIPQSIIQGLPIERDTLDGIRITKPARELAKAEGIDLATLPRNQLITEASIRSILRKPEVFDGYINQDHHIIVFGGGGHGKSIIELLKSEGSWDLLGVIDDGLMIGESVLGAPVLGGASILASLRIKGLKYAVNAVGGIGNLEIRIKIFDIISQAGLTCPVVIHPKAVREPSSAIQNGSQIFALAYVGSSTRIGFGCILNTGTIVSHDCIVGDYSIISPGAILAGGVIIEEQVMVGMGVTINLNVKIGASARIGNGATIKSDVPAGTIVKAGAIWPA